MPVWLDLPDVIYFQRQLLREHGGMAGVPDEDRLHSALARPRNLLAHEPAATLFQLAASYGFGLARNHCFPDGNKRIALVAVDTFLQINGYQLTAEEAETVIVIQEVASGGIEERAFAGWIKLHSSPFDLETS